MLYVTGDTHGEWNRWNCLIDCYLSEGDMIFICGDFGYIFDDNKAENRFLDELEEKPYTILFLYGNHENHERLAAYPEESWAGGRIHRVRKNVIHLMRGQVYHIEEKRFFIMGGAYSIDRAMRIEGISWWPQEMPSEAEYDEARKNLAACNYQVDYILTHAAPEDTMSLFHPYHPDEVKLNFFLEWVRENTSYQHWYMGHLHQDRDMWRNQTILWYELRKLETGELVNGAELYGNDGNDL